MPEDVIFLQSPVSDRDDTQQGKQPAPQTLFPDYRGLPDLMPDDERKPLNQLPGLFETLVFHNDSTRIMGFEVQFQLGPSIGSLLFLNWKPEVVQW
ncbi:MAG: hypothetical protein BWY82_00657 [Verrucomicrobia bacterium ADurb.Bin474]|nr:MAG: hypothetical protein BWY82_00657 [Verrucomicrobia bacterium ADurb.Bin474]